MGIGETLRRALAKLVMRADGEQVTTACGNLQLCAVLGAGIEGSTHSLVQTRLERIRVGVDACNGFNELSRLAILLTVHHRLP